MLMNVTPKPTFVTIMPDVTTQLDPMFAHAMMGILEMAVFVLVGVSEFIKKLFKYLKNNSERMNQKRKQVWITCTSVWQPFSVGNIKLAGFKAVYINCKSFKC
jgi:hypothetical protein